MQVSYKDVHSEIISGSDRAISHVNNWSRKYSPIANDVFSFVHEKLFDVNTQDILDTLKRSDHPLGNISKKQRLLEVED